MREFVSKNISTLSWTGFIIEISSCCSDFFSEGWEIADMLNDPLVQYTNQEYADCRKQAGARCSGIGSRLTDNPGIPTSLQRQGCGNIGRKAAPKKIFILMCLTVIVLIFSDCFLFSAAAESKDDAYSTFDNFMAAAAGRYTSVTDDGTVVLELIPAFGHLFGGAGYYMEGSLYSYYAAEFTPASWLAHENSTAQYSSRSMDFIIQFFSNMSNAGNYWDGLSQQRLTLFQDDLLLSHYVGDGDGLISKNMVLMNKHENAPTLFPYNAGMAEKLNGKEWIAEKPDFLTGSFCSSWKEDDVELIQQISFDEKGEVMLLRQKNDLTPPLLLKGGYALSVNGDDSCELCYLMSSPSSGTMPYSGCAVVQNNNGSLIFEESEDDWNQLLTGPNARQLYANERQTP